MVMRRAVSRVMEDHRHAGFGTSDLQVMIGRSRRDQGGDGRTRRRKRDHIEQQHQPAGENPEVELAYLQPVAHALVE